MVFLFFHNFLPNKSFLPKPTFLGSSKMSKKVQKGPEAPKPIFLKVVGEFLVFLDFFVWGYRRVFWVPEGILCDGGSSVVWHADLSTTRSQVRIPPPAGGRGEINHNKSERSIINQWINGINPWKRSKNVKTCRKRSSGPKTNFSWENPPPPTHPFGPFLGLLGLFWAFWVLF